MRRPRRLTSQATAALVASAVSAALAAGPWQSPRPAALLDEAVQAEAALRFDAAADRLYRIVIEHPRSAEARTARGRLARLLALAGNLPAAILQCQAIADELAADDPERQPAADLATLLARRFRAPRAQYFASTSVSQAAGLRSTDEPTHLEVDPAGRVLLVDAGDGRGYLLTGDAASPVPSAGDLTAAAFLADGGLVVADRAGIAVGRGAPVYFSATWGGRTRQLRKTRSMAVTPAGDLLLVDRDYEGVLRCPAGSTACAPWGPAGRYRAIAAGAGGFVWALEDRQRAVRLVDRSGRQAAIVGPVFAGGEFREIVDIAADGAHGLYVLDRTTRRVDVLVVRADAANVVSVVHAGWAAVPRDGTPSMRTPSAIGVTPDGRVLVAGRSTPQVLRFQ